VSDFRSRDESNWDDSDAAWKGRQDFVRSILEWPRYRRLQSADKEDIVSRVHERAFEFTRIRVPDNERGWLTQLTYWEAARPIELAPPEPPHGGHEPVHENPDDDRPAIERLLDVVTPGEIRFLLRTFFGRFAPQCHELFEASLEFGGLVRLARSRSESENTVTVRWKRCKDRLRRFAEQKGIEGLLDLMRAGAPG
jgi:hypothetical protein